MPVEHRATVKKINYTPAKTTQMHLKWDNRSDRGNTEKGIKPGNIELRLNCMMKRLKACGKELSSSRNNSPQDRRTFSLSTIFTLD